MKKPTLHLVHAALGGGVLYWVLDLSQSGRSAVDWTVISLVSCAILWNLVQLGRRLYKAGGAKALWHMQHTALFWIIGLFNTALIRPEDVGSWKNWVGWVLLAIAVGDTVALLRRERECLVEPAPDAG